MSNTVELKALLEATLVGRPKDSSIEGLILMSCAIILEKLEASRSDPVADVHSFMDKFHIGYHGKPRVINEDMEIYRAELLREEVNEYLQAESEVDTFDALLDIVYVAIGTCIIHGWDFREGWRRVHASNMAKIKGNGDPSKPRNQGAQTWDITKPPGWKAPHLRDLTAL